MNTEFEFASKNYTAGQLNAMVKKIIEQVGEKGPDLLRQGKLKIEIIKDSILNIIGTTTISATTEKFVAKEKFVVNTDSNASVKISYISDKFQNWFLAGNGKIEDPLGEQELRYGNLTKSSVDGLIINELGGETKVETTLAEMYDLFKRQANGEDSVLLTNHCSNIFYVRDTSGVLRAVIVNWIGDGWFVHAISVGYSEVLSADLRVFARAA